MDSIEENEKNAIDNALLQMEILYKCRCIQPPFGTNVTVREIEKDKQDPCNAAPEGTRMGSKKSVF